MAKKRMFSIYVIDTDAFLDMPLSAQALYFHLNMRADDDGFIGNPKRVMRLIGAADDRPGTGHGQGSNAVAGRQIRA